MRNAPSVLIPVGRSRFGAWVCALTWFAGLALWGAWWWQVPDPAAWAGLSWPQAVMAGALLVCGAWAVSDQRRTARGLLDWNGESWCWTTAGGACEVRVAVACDLQRWVLVRLEPVDGAGAPAGSGSDMPRGAQWLWLAPSGAASHWRAVRRALYCPGASQASPEPPALWPTVPP